MEKIICFQLDIESSWHRLNSSVKTFFENAAKFMPDRHKNLGKAEQQAFNTFGGGKHLCRGRHFALNEPKLIVISMLQKFDCNLKSSDFSEPVYVGSGFLFPNRDM